MIRIMNTKLVCQIHLNRVRTKKLIFPGVGLIEPAGVGLPGVKLDWLARTAEWAGSHNLSKLNENRAPTLTACEEAFLHPLSLSYPGLKPLFQGFRDMEMKPRT